jgi:predicted metal-dependent hydrolase
VQLALPFGDAPSAPEAPQGGTPPLSYRFVRHRRAKRYVLRVDHDGSVRVTIPRGGSRRGAEAFIARNRGWIERQRSRVPKPALSAGERALLARRARVELPARLNALAGELGLAVSRVSIRNQRSRWGSCGRGGDICLNWRLVMMPDWVCHYVLVHELMHLRRFDHSPEYWRLVAGACPRYREARQWLRMHGPSLR